MLNPYRFFDPNPDIRKIAFDLYASVRDLPIVCPHGHVDPKILANNEPFPDPTELIIIPDHYIFRMLYSRGFSMESLGVPVRNGIWLTHELVEVFGIKEKLTGANADKIYDQLQERLESPEFLPRSLFDRFNIEVLTTTDAAADSLEHHRKIRKSEWKGRVVPCFRPDAVVDIMRSNWKEEIEALSAACGIDIHDFKSFIAAFENRRVYFKEMGATSTDQGIVSPCTHEISPRDADAIFHRALKGQAASGDAELFTANMLMEMARMSVEDGLVMQIHPGSFRNHNRFIFERFGLDKGCDIPLQTEYTRNLYEILNKYGNDPRLTLVVFTLDESTYSRELAPLAGHYPALKLGPAWWFHDSIEGMTRFRERVTETAGIYNTVGFNDDTRAFPSIPARHDLSRRIDANFLARLVARHIIDEEDARRMIRALSYELVKSAYKLG
jgi:glucuronate isomerase